MFEINPITHLIGQLGPLVCIHHHILTASVIIVIYTNLLTDILLCYTKRFLHRQFNRQSVGIPACLTLHLETFHCLVAQECILDGTPHHVMNSRMTIGRWRTLIEYELWATLTFINTLVEDIILHPLFQHLLISLCKVQTFMLGKSLSHNSYPIL